MLGIMHGHIAEIRQFLFDFFESVQCNAKLFYVSLQRCTYTMYLPIHSIWKVLAINRGDFSQNSFSLFGPSFGQ